MRTGPVGLRFNEVPIDVAAMYAAPDWSTLPFIKSTGSDWRLYACQCQAWDEPDQHYLENDHDSPGEPNLPWACAGHPAPALPVTLGELTIAEDSDWAAIVQRILDGACPRKLDRADEGPWLWLPWLYAYLADLPAQGKLSSAIGERVGDRAEPVVAAVLAFFRRFPTAPGIEHVVARAERDLDAVFTGHKIPEVDHSPDVWGVLVSAMMVRSPAMETRIVDVTRKAMLRPAGKPDAIQELLTSHFDSWFREDDLAWMAEHVAALDAAGPGRWKKVMTTLVRASRKNSEYAHLIVVGGLALIQSRRVPFAEIRAWMEGAGHKSEPWVVALEAGLDH